MSTLPELLTRLAAGRRQLDREAGEARAVATAGKQVLAEITTLTGSIELHERAAGFLATLGEQRQTQAQAHIEALVTQGLRTVFDEDLSFHLVAGVRGKVPVVDFVIRSTMDGTVVETDMRGRGGGLIATVGFLLRVVILLLTAGRQETVLFLDETFGPISADHGPRLAEFLRELVDKTGIQIVIVTHTHADPLLDAADTRYQFELVDGATRVKTL